MDFSRVNLVLGVFLLACPLSKTLTYEEVCYETVGCFSDAPPFSNTDGVLPESPSKVDPQYRLYKGKGIGPIPLDYMDSFSAGALSLDLTVPTVFIIHGYANSLESEWIQRMTDALFDHGKYNVIQVGWNADFPRIKAASANTRIVGKTTSLLIDMLRRKGLDLSKVHMVGHSLGAHIAGYAGTNVGYGVGRITGLDPAGYLFDDFSAAVHLDPTDAKFVDVIHTNGYPYNKYTITGFGSAIPLGHVDFYPNGGVKQPGCTDGLHGAITNLFDNLLHDRFINLTANAFAELGCSHGRSIDIFIESIKPSHSSASCSFVAHSCKSYEDFSSAKCLNKCSPNQCDKAGIDTDIDANGRKEYFKTLDTTPLCAYQYIATIVPDGDTSSFNGKLTATFTTSRGQEKVIINSGGDIPIKKDTPYSIVVAHGSEITGPITNVLLQYDRGHIFARRSIMLKKFEWQKISGDRTKYETITTKSFELSTTNVASEPMAVTQS